MSFTPLGCINALILTGVPEGWEYTEAAHAFFGPELAMVEAVPVRGGRWLWEANDKDLDETKRFAPNKLREAMAWASR